MTSDLMPAMDNNAEAACGTCAGTGSIKSNTLGEIDCMQCCGYGVLTTTKDSHEKT